MIYKGLYHPITVKELLSYIDDSQRSHKFWHDIFNSILKLISVPLYVKDREGRFIYFNEKFLDLLKKNYKDVGGKTLLDIFPNDPLCEKLHKMDLTVMETGRENIGEYFIRDCQGRILKRHCLRSCFFDDLEKIMGIIGVIEERAQSGSIGQVLSNKFKDMSIISQLQEVVSKSLDTEVLVRQTTKFIYETLNVDACLLLLTQGENLLLKGSYPELSAIHGLKAEISQIRRCLCKLSLKKKKIQYIADLKSSKSSGRLPCSMAGFTSLVSVPLITEDRVYGVLALASKTERRFGSEAELLGIIGGIVSVALKNSLLYQDLKKANARYKIVADHTKNFEFWISTQGDFRYASPASEYITGFPPKSFYKDATLLEKLILPQDLPLWHTAVQEENSSPFTMRIRHKDGGIKWTECTAYKIYKDNNELLGIRGSISDITKSYEAKRAEEKSQKLLNSIFNSINDPMFMINHEYEIQMINKAALNYFDIKDPKTLGKKCFQVISNRNSPCGKCASLLDSELLCTDFEKTIKKKDGEHIIRVFLHRVYDEAHAIDGTLVHIKDITLEKVIERELINSEKLSMLGILSASMAHEINHPNNLILFNLPILKQYIEALLELIRQETPKKTLELLELFGLRYDQFIEDLFNLLDDIYQGGKRIEAIINRLQLFVQPSDYKSRSKVAVKEIVERSLNMCASKIYKVVKSVEVQIAEDIPPLYINREALEHVLVNLLLNAIQAMDKPEPYLCIRAYRGTAWNESIVVEVIDNGKGIEDSELNKIFDPFYSRNRSTGLGLFISKNLIETIGGTIEVNTKKGYGTTFKIKIPVSQSGGWNSNGLLHNDH